MPERYFGYAIGFLLFIICLVVALKLLGIGL